MELQPTQLTLNVDSVMWPHLLIYTANNLRILIDLIEVCIRLNNLLDTSLLGNGLIQLLYQPKIKFDLGKIHASIILQGEIKQYFCLVCIQACIKTMY